MVINGQALATLNVGYNASFQKGFDETTVNFEKFTSIIKSITKDQSYAWIGNLGSMKEWIGEREVQSLSASDYTIKNKSFERTIGVPRDDIDDDQYGVWNPVFQDMGQEAKRHPNRLSFEALREGFTNKCYDGLPFFSASHKNGEYEYSNKGTKKLTAESYNEARVSMMNIKKENGDPLGVVPDLLVVPPQLEHTARLIVKAEVIDGTTNVDKDTAEILVDPELATSPDAWYLLCTSRSLKPIIYQERKPCQFVTLVDEKDTNVFMRKEFLYGCDSRGNVGYGFPQMAYGSDGTVAG